MSRRAGCRTATPCSRRPRASPRWPPRPRRRWRRSSRPSASVYGIQFHPEVVHTPYGQQVLTNFLADICGCDGTWSAASVIEDQIERIRAQVGEGRAICGLSGGVDSSVAALLVHRAIGDRLTCVFVDHGLMRKNEGAQVISAFRDHFKVPLVAVDAEDRFLERLRGVSDPERKRKLIGAEFIRVFEEEAARLDDVSFLVQGTLYSDVIESGGGHRRGHDQVPPQRRRPARGPRVRARRAAAGAVQGRGPQGRRRARAARAARLAPAVPRARAWRSGSSAARPPASGSTRCARPTRSSRTRSARPGCTASCGSPSACCPTSGRSACRATSAPTAT